MEENQNLIENEELSEISDKLDKTLTLESSSTRQSDDDEEEEEDENGDENEEFEFCFLGGLKSPVSAEEVFEDGQIRVISPFPGEYSGEGETSSSSTYGRTVKNVFVVSNSPENDDVAEEGSYCVWKAPSPEMSQKSNSTGFSKLRKMRDLLARSNSDGKDAFVFLNGKTDASGSGEAKRKEKEKKKKELKIEVADKKGGGETTAFGGERKEGKKKKEKSAYEALYLGGGKDKKKGGGKSYLPYRQDLVGFFTNGSVLSRNVHPY
ncbi:uncharacterized protein LOC110708726 [Chenopodium quinoa]|uniref:uncharacterized protein LOC110708726 n=1 Tax=Chenopodium quinoa TaxID=63459 RepID=UPI000B792F6F|nr:uncharacterized protein LOC110708726 [Chenopodium quinoa]